MGLRNMTIGKIEIIFHATFREITKERKIIEHINDDCTFGIILAELARKYANDFDNVINPQTGKISNDILVMLNGKGIREIDEKIKNGDVLIFSLPVGGG
ncbi:MAG: MoaD/ThiS family protein [Candidatus Hodarchaeales archaeon]